jgi:hypothetical protein
MNVGCATMSNCLDQTDVKSMNGVDELVSWVSLVSRGRTVGQC